MEIPYMETEGDKGLGLPLTQERLKRRKKKKKKTKPMLQS